MRHLMGDEPLAGKAVRIVLPIAEHNIAADRVRAGGDRTGSLSCCGAGVHPDLAEIVPEPRFQEPPGRRRQWRSGRLRNIKNMSRNAHRG